MQSTPPPHSSKLSYDVFISFRGVDTRYGFTGNLYNALSNIGIRTFIDDTELQRGEEITPSLLKSIENSRIAIIIFSKNYASSSFCLDELAHIIHYFQEKKRHVLPVFYDVEPRNVRNHTKRSDETLPMHENQNRSYADALAMHEMKFQNDKENMERFTKWKIALERAANLSGYHFKLGNEEYEYKFIAEIVTHISNRVNRVILNVAVHPVGLESKLLKVKSLLDVECNTKVYMIGICGSAGMGKTTLARAIYNLIADQFESSCFLHDVRGNSIKYGLEYLQEQLLLKSIGLKIRFGDYSEGTETIKQRLHQKKILLILDDVDKLKQLQVLVGEPTWLCPGSRVIITTQDKQLLLCHGIKNERIYDLGVLSDKESLELFSWMAFKSNKIDASYDDILNRAVKYASGLPLALEVVGSNLFGKTIAEWESTLDMYKRIPNNEIQETLKVSFDGLEEEQQNVFLDIACYFKWHRLEEVEEILHGHYGHCIKSHLGVLVDKSLIKLSNSLRGRITLEDLDKDRLSIMDTITLHNLIEDMGKEIVRKESPKESGERSRLWCHDDIVHVLQENTGTSKIEMIYLNSPSMEAVVEWNGDSFEKMIKLKTLIIRNGHFSKGPKYLPSTLRVLKWKGYPLESPSSTTNVLNKAFKNMKILNLDDCEYLTEISDISGLSNLEKLSFENCKNLITIHDSIGYLSRLQILNAMGCEKLLSIPPLKLISLLELKLSGCKSLEKFPEISDKMKKIEKIVLENIGIQELPFSFQYLSELSFLSITGRGKLRLPSSILEMSNLLEVHVYGYSQLLPKPNNNQSSMLSSKVKRLFLDPSDDEFLMIALMWFTNVESLSLKGSNLKILPKCLEKCRFLESINLDDCQFLEEIRGVPPNLKTLTAIGCKSLTSSSKRMLMIQELHEAGGTEFYFPSSRSDRIPEWFERQTQRRESSISFYFRNKLPSLVFYFSSKRMCELGSNIKNPADIIVYMVINGEVYSLFHSHLHSRFRRNYTYLLSFDIQHWTKYINKIWSKSKDEIDHVLEPNLVYESEKDVELFKSRLDEALLKNEWVHAEVSFGFGGEYTCWDDNDVVESGVHVLQHLTSMDDFQFTDDCLPEIVKQQLSPPPQTCSIM